MQFLNRKNDMDVVLSPVFLVKTSKQKESKHIFWKKKRTVLLKKRRHKRNHFQEVRELSTP